MSEVSTAQVLLIVRFKSGLTPDALERVYKERLPEFRKIPGLIQKYYAYDEATEEWGGVYVWDSPEAVEKYMDSDLRKTIASAYEVQGVPRVDRLSVLTTLHP